MTSKANDTALDTESRELHAENIPEILKALGRWAPWEAVWNEARHKFDKIPKDARHPVRKLSTSTPDRWFTFADSLTAFHQHPDKVHGVGFCITALQGFAFLDLDGCIDPAGVVAPWAQDVVDGAGSYTEISPSGRGLRIVVRVAERPEDWNNHDVGIEVYAGATPRFLTVTGRHVKGTPRALKTATAGFLEGLEKQYRKSASKPGGEALPVPDISHLDGAELLAEALANVDAFARKVLAGEALGTDRSLNIFAAANALVKSGFDGPQSLAILLASAAGEAALDKRGQDPDKATAYLWGHHVCKAIAAHADSDFSDLTVLDAESPEASPTAAPAEPAEGSTTAAPAEPAEPTPTSKAGPRTYTAASDVAKRPPSRDLIRGVLPEFAVGCVFGPSGSGKSFVAFSLINSLVTGEPWNGHPVIQPGRALYVALEGAGGLGRRVRAHEKHFKVQYGDRLVVVEGSLNLTDKADTKAFILEVQALGRFSTIWIDTTSQASPGADENNSQGMGLLLAHCKQIAHFTKAGVMLVSHTGKDTTKGVRGWSGQRAAMDVQLEVVYAPTSKTRTLKVDKAKDGPDSAEWPFELLVVDLGTDFDGNPVTSCVAVPAAADATTTAGPDRSADRQKAWARGANQQAIESALRELWMFERSPIARPMLVRTAVSHRGARALEYGEERSTKLIADGVREAIDAMLSDGRLVNTDGLLTAPMLHVDAPPALAPEEGESMTT